MSLIFLNSIILSPKRFSAAECTNLQYIGTRFSAAECTSLQYLGPGFSVLAGGLGTDYPDLGGKIERWEWVRSKLLFVARFDLTASLSSA